MSENTSNSTLYLDTMFPSQETVNDIHLIHLCMERLAAETKLCFFGSIQAGIPAYRDDGKIALQRVGLRIIQLEEPFGHSLYMQALNVMISHIDNTLRDFPFGILHHLLLDHVLGILKKETGGNPLPVSKLDPFRELDYPDRPDPLTPSSSDDEIISHIKEGASGSPLARALLKDINDAIGRISSRADICVFIQIHFVCGLHYGTIRIGDLGLALGMAKILDILLIEQILSGIKDFSQNHTPMMSLDEIQSLISKVQLLDRRRAEISPRIHSLSENINVDAWGITNTTEKENLELSNP